MTCIVGLEEDGVIYVGGDSAAIDIESLEISRRNDEKVFLSDDNNFIIGFAGSFRCGQLMRYAVNVPARRINQDDMSYLVNDFVDCFKTTLREKTTLKKENEVEDIDTTFVLGYNGKLYTIDKDFQVGCPLDNFVSIGCGAHVALGALYATKELKMKPIKRITLALKAAEEYSAGVRAPFRILKLDQSVDVEVE